MTQTIYTKCGTPILVDEEDFAELNKHKWKLNRDGYAYRLKHKAYVDGVRKFTNVSMHRQIMGLPDCIVDHIDMNPLNNQRENLRLATHSQNRFNRDKQKNNTTGYKGVTLHKKAGKYIAHIGKDGKTHYLGLFNTPEEAAKVYNEAAIRMHGEFAKLNDVN